eukprot:GEMP01021850.1.p1 GENE.GEMP01021850.1~~GEMP01021850.1.p1  ORF type:complete len:108 (+),score=9.88 GEMP01021850.1:1690-2013(+)
MLQRLIDTRGNITVFIRPAKRSNLKLVQMLIDTHAYVNRTNYTVFHVKMAQRLIDTRAHINRTNGTAFIWSATHDTCENGAKAHRHSRSHQSHEWHGVYLVCHARYM